MSLEQYTTLAQSEGITLGRSHFNDLGLNLNPVISLCPDIENYFAFSIPENVLEVNFIRLLCKEEMLEEMTKYVPGIYLKDLGFLVLATDGSGDNFVTDIRTGKVYKASHDIYAEDGIRMSGETLPYDYENVLKSLSEVTGSIEDFLEQFSQKNLI